MTLHELTLIILKSTHKLSDIEKAIKNTYKNIIVIAVSVYSEYSVLILHDKIKDIYIIIRKSSTSIDIKYTNGEKGTIELYKK